MCRFMLVLTPNFWLQIGRWKFLFFSWTILMCFFTMLLNPVEYLHIGHWYFLMFSWTDFMCPSKLFLSPCNLWQIGHWKSFRLSWTHLCDVSDLPTNQNVFHRLNINALSCSRRPFAGGSSEHGLSRKLWNLFGTRSPCSVCECLKCESASCRRLTSSCRTVRTRT